MVVFRNTFYKMLTRIVLALFAGIELGDWAVITHDACPNFTWRALFLHFRGENVHIFC